MIPESTMHGFGRMNMVTIAGQSWAVGNISTVGQTALTTSPVSRALCFPKSKLDPVSGIVGTEDLRLTMPLREKTTVVSGSVLGETVASAFAAQVAALSGITHRLLVGNWGKGGAAYSALAKGTVTYARGQALARAARQSFPEMTYRATLALHGASDSNSATYQTDARQWQLDWETDTNLVTNQTGTIPWFVTQSSAATGAGAVIGTVGLFEEFKLNPTKTVLVGPMYFIPVGNDNVHFTSAGTRLLGEYYGAAYYRQIILATQWNPLRPTAINRVTNVVTLTFADAVGPLVLDTVRVTDPGNFGFEWNDDAARTITGVRLLGGNLVEITLSGTPTINANTKVRYAYTAVTALVGGPLLGQRGCLRDSNTAVGVLSGSSLYNWCVHFNETVT